MVAGAVGAVLFLGALMVVWPPLGRATFPGWDPDPAGAAWWARIMVWCVLTGSLNLLAGLIARDRRWALFGWVLLVLGSAIPSQLLVGQVVTAGLALPAVLDIPKKHSG